MVRGALALIMHSTELPRANYWSQQTAIAAIEALTSLDYAGIITFNYGATGKSKHFERWVSYARDLYQRFIIDVIHIPTEKMPADIFTKALPYEPFSTFRSFLLGRRST